MKKMICAAGVVALAGTASADMLMQTLTFGPNTPDFSEVMTFDQFDGIALEDVLSIEVKMAITVSGGTATVDNDGAAPTTVDIDFGTSGSISSPDVTLLDAAFDPVVAGVDVLAMASPMLAANDGDDPLAFNDDGGADNFTLPGTGGSDSDSGFINSLFWGDFLGGGTFEIEADLDSAFSVSGGSGVSGAFTPQSVEGNVMVTINFVPAPGSVALLGLGGFVATRRRR